MSIFLIWGIKIPEPVIRAVRKQDERCFYILCVPPCLLPRIIRITVFAFGFEHARCPAVLVHEKVVGSTRGVVLLESHLMWIFKIPSAGCERLVDSDTSGGFGLVYRHRYLFVWTSHNTYCVINTVHQCVFYWVSSVEHFTGFVRGRVGVGGCFCLLVGARVGKTLNDVLVALDEVLH